MTVLRIYLRLLKKQQQQQQSRNKYTYIFDFHVHKHHLEKPHQQKWKNGKKVVSSLYCINIWTSLRRWVKLNSKLNFTVVTQSINTNKTNHVCIYYIISCALVLFRRSWRSMAGWELKWASACLMVTLERCFSSLFRNISTRWDLQPFRQLVPVVHYVCSLFTTLGSENMLFSFLKQHHILGDHYHMSYSPSLLGLNSLQFFWSVLTDTFAKFLIVPTILWTLVSPNLSWKCCWKPDEDCSRGLGITKQNQRIVSHAGCTCRSSLPRTVFPFFQYHGQLKIHCNASILPGELLCRIE